MQIPLPLLSKSAHPQGTPFTLLSVEGLTFRVPQRTLFSDWSARIGPGVTLLLGGEGSGKTTLLRLLAGELPVASGHVLLQGVSLSEASPAYRAQVFWQPPGTDALDALTPLDYFDQLRSRYPAFLPQDAPAWAALLAGLSLNEHLTKPLYMLSTGSKRKVWLAAAFAAGATLTLLDDPFAALDKPSICFVLQQLAAAARWSDRACVLAHYEAPEGVALAQVITLDA